MIIGIIAVFTLLICYFLPTIIAVFRNLEDCPIILISNTLTGWTGLGWVLSLLWSIKNDK